MNGLTLRISRSGGKKPKNSIGFAPVEIPISFLPDTGDNGVFKSFIQSSTTDDQLIIIKQSLDTKQDLSNNGVIKFLVIIFWQAEAKHPVKCFITRYVTKTPNLQNQFTEALASLLSQHVAAKPTDYKIYIPVVSKVVSCIENFPTGVAAVRAVEEDLAGYLRHSLDCCVKALRESFLSPTEKNELFNLAHLSLRMLLHIVQKSNIEAVRKLTYMFSEIRMIIKYLLFDDDSPMDTKSVCGILYLSMHITEHGAERWLDILNTSHTDESLRCLLANEAARLALYSAIATVVPVERLQSHSVDNVPAIVDLTKKILDIGERSSSESTFILGVTRSLTQISKQLEKTTDSSVGLTLVDCLLSFTWSHLEHYMDSVRHLTAQMLACVVKYCAMLKKEGNDKAILSLWSALSSLGARRKSYFVCVSRLCVELGAAAVLAARPGLVQELLAALAEQPLQASATVALESLLAAESSAHAAFTNCVLPVLQHVACGTYSGGTNSGTGGTDSATGGTDSGTGGTDGMDSGTLHALQGLLTRAVRQHHSIMTYIIPYLKQSTSEKCHDLKCTLMLLSVARKSGVVGELGAPGSDKEWNGLISYQALRRAAVDAVDETRVLSLSLVVESPKSTEGFTAGELSLVLWYLRHNINAQAPSFRQLTLSLMKKFVKRLEDSYKVLTRQQGPNAPSDRVQCYLQFVEDLRCLCFESLVPGANYSRRCTALQVLVWCEHLNLEGYHRAWRTDYVETLLLHLEDSYENNKSFALEVLQGCPVELLKCKTYSISLDIEHIFRQASSLKPTDCVSASFKLDLLKRKLPENILEGRPCDCSEPVALILLQRLLGRLLAELATCRRSVVGAARQAPMYGVLHCMGHVVGQLDARAISGDAVWTGLVADMITTAIAASAAVASVVNNSSPEGHLPMDLTGVSVSDDGNSGGVRLDDGRIVTSQMVLLCAWRTVKEVSLLLGSISSRLTITGEVVRGTLSVDQLAAVGQHFTSLLAQTKHRGAFEQAYVGFTRLLSRLWRCRTRELHELPRTWLADLIGAVAASERRGALCATRRSAGLPYMIQALVTTELEVEGNPRGFHECMTTLLRIARATHVTHESHEPQVPHESNEPRVLHEPQVPHEPQWKAWQVEARTHALNILRALYRNSALEDAVAPYVGEGLMVALTGFEGGTWAERNSSTLALSALCTRVFGVQRARTVGVQSARSASVRDRMTGRIFFLRYPRLYDFMLDKMQEVSADGGAGALRPCLYPILLLLARLYPSSLEGTVSNLKLVAFVPHVLSCARSGVLKTRQLAAKAMVPLISPDQYLPHVRSMFQLLSDRSIKRNFCHGVLLQLVRLLEAPPGGAEGAKGDHQGGLAGDVKTTLWILGAGVGEVPCYLIVDEYVKVLNMIMWRLPSLLETDTIKSIINHLDTIIFQTKSPKITSGREICLANCTYLYFVLLTKYKVNNICDLIHKSLQHPCYEVLLSALNYLLILYDNLETENSFQQHIKLIADKSLLDELITDEIGKGLLDGILESKYLECKRKSLKVLTLQDKRKKYDLDRKALNELVRNKMAEYTSNVHESMSHIYLERLLDLVTNVLPENSMYCSLLLDVLRLVLECSSSDNGEDTRGVVVAFLERNTELLLKLDLSDLDENETFEFKATTWAVIVTLLEDDDATYRQRLADCVAVALGTTRLLASVTGDTQLGTTRLTPSVAGDIQLGTTRLTTNVAGDKELRTTRVVPSAVGDAVRSYMAEDGQAAPLFCVLALLDFKSVVCTSDDLGEEARVFDQNERYNVFLEETTWTAACARRLLGLCGSHVSPGQFVLSVVDDPRYAITARRLCGDHLTAFETALRGNGTARSDVVNPKIAHFVELLRR